MFHTAAAAELAMAIFFFVVRIGFKKAFKQIHDGNGFLNFTLRGRKILGINIVDNRECVGRGARLNRIRVVVAHGESHQIGWNRETVVEMRRFVAADGGRSHLHAVGYRGVLRWCRNVNIDGFDLVVQILFARPPIAGPERLRQGPDDGLPVMRCPDICIFVGLRNARIRDFNGSGCAGGLRAAQIDGQFGRALGKGQVGRAFFHRTYRQVVIEIKHHRSHVVQRGESRGHFSGQLARRLRRVDSQLQFVVRDVVILGVRVYRNAHQRCRRFHFRFGDAFYIGNLSDGDGKCQ